MSQQSGLARRLISVGIITLALRVITLVSKLLLTLAMARMLSTTDVGSYGLVVAILSISTVAVGLELYTQGNRELVGLAPVDQVRIIRDQFILYGATYFAAGIVLFGTVLLDFVSAAFGGIVLGLLILDHFSQECFRVLIYLSRTVWANLILFFRAGVWAYVAIAMMFVYPSLRVVESVFLLWAVGALAS
ncbi:MAG: hypothetical protein K8F25_18715, partial [Fimbriimonadaceae bacterium]|nr:hypothetical protein [Alphaproteobacteria bacterium]